MQAFSWISSENVENKDARHKGPPLITSGEPFSKMLKIRMPRNTTGEPFSKISLNNDLLKNFPLTY
jgi:hypothetical protein